MWYQSRSELDLISKAGLYHYINDRGNPVVRMHSSFWLECEADDTAFTEPVKRTGNWEAWNAVAMSNELIGDVEFIDIGANVGYYTLMAATSRKQVVCFEPNDKLVTYIGRSIDLNDCLDDVLVIEMAVGDKEETLRLYNHEGHSGANSLYGDGEDYIEVPVTTLDKIYKGTFIKNKRVIKVDVEGFEKQVWDGSNDFRKKFKDNVWFVEWVPVRHGEEYNREWLDEVLKTHDLQMVNHDGSLRNVTIDDALAVEFETIVFRSRS